MLSAAVVLRTVPPPDFRYVGLAPGLLSSDLALVAAGASTGLAGVLLFSLGPHASTVVASVVAGGLTAIALGRRGPIKMLTRLGASPTAMAIVPWGVLVHPDGELERVLRWSGVRSVSVDFVHTRDAAGTPSTSWSFVTVETEREKLVGQAAGPVALERLVAHLEAYADESAKAVALDLDGETAGPVSGFEPVARALLGRARELVGSGYGADRLSLSGGHSYRGESSRVVSEETVETLREALRKGASAPSDPRALAAIVAGEIGATALVPELLRLVTAVHPVVAVAAKAAALKLGAEPTRAGSLTEVGPFLLEDDLEALEAWVHEGPRRSAF